MTIQELVALSVSKLENALKDHSFTADELAEAIELEKAADNRKTAIEALEAAIEQPAEPTPEPKVVKVCEGKAITSKIGVLGPDAEVKAEYLAGGADALKVLIEKGYCK